MQCSWVYRLDHNRQTQCKTSSSTPPSPPSFSSQSISQSINQSVNQSINQSIKALVARSHPSLFPSSLFLYVPPPHPLCPRLTHTPSIAFRHLPPRKDVVNQCLEFASLPPTPLSLRVCACARACVRVSARARVCVCVCVNVRARANTISRYAASCAKFPEHVLCYLCSVGKLNRFRTCSVVVVLSCTPAEKRDFSLRRQLLLTVL